MRSRWVNELKTKKENEVAVVLVVADEKKNTHK